MAVKIRFCRKGKKNRAFFRLVAIDSRSPRDGKYLDNLGWYDPFQKKSKLDKEKIIDWIKKGAIVSEKAKIFIKREAKEIVL